MIYEVDAKYWCPLHLPVAKKEVREASPNGQKQYQTPLHQITKRLRNIIKQGQSNVIDLSGIVFYEYFDFGDLAAGQKDFNSIIISNAHFSNGVSISNCKFGGTSFFDNIVSNNRFDIAGSRFGSAVFFSDCIIEDYFNGRGAIFEAFSDFRNSKFKSCDFGFADFQSPVRFENMKVEGHASFLNAKIKLRASFIKVKILGTAVFDLDLNQISDSTSMRQFEFGRLIFDYSQFLGEVSFKNRIFSNTTSFEFSQFSIAPYFHKSTLHSDTHFLTAIFKDCSSKSAVSSYRTLKLAMEGHRARAEEAMFYALEQESIRNQPDTPFAVKLFSLLYQWGSDYGRNFVAPFAWLIYFGLYFSFMYSMSGEAKPEALSFTVQQYVRPFLVWGEANVSVWIKLLASVQSLMGLGLGTLFVLAVRRRFRMG